MIGGGPEVSASQRGVALRSAWRANSERALRALGLAIALAAALTCPTAANADTGATLHVAQGNPQCSDTGAGTAAQPFCTIGAAAAKTAPGTTVIISTGTYAETVRPPVGGTAGNPITYTAAPGANVSVTGSSSSSYAFYDGGQSWITVEGLTLTAVEVTYKYALTGPAASPSNVEIADNQVTGTVSVDAGSQMSVSGNRANAIHLNATASDVKDNSAGSVSLYNTTQSRVAANSISPGNLYVYEGSGDTLSANVIRTTGKGIDAEETTDVAIVNNAVVIAPSASCGMPAPAPCSPSYGIEVLGGGGAQIVSNSVAQFSPSDAVEVDGDATLANNAVEAFHSAGGAAIHVCSGCQAATTMDHDVVYAAHGTVIYWNGWSYSSLAKATAATGQEAHGIQAPAGFADPANGNLTLTPGSPAVDSALSGTLTTPSGSLALPATDAFGGARVDDAATANTGGGTVAYADRGAYEMHNPGLEANTAGWNTSGAGPGVMLSRVAGGHSGTGAALLTNTAATRGTCTLNDSPNIVHTTAAGTYTATVWVRADNPGATLTLRLREWLGATAVGQAKTLISLSTQWQPVTVQYTALDPRTSTLDLSAYVMNAPSGSCFYADDASIAVAQIAPPAAAANRLTAPDGAADDGLGQSVAVSGDTMVVGAPYASVNGRAGQGAVYVYTKVNGIWIEEAKLLAADGAAHDQFGYSVAISGATAVVGAPAAVVNGQAKRGAAYVFTQSGGVWTQQTKETASDGVAGDQLGISVAVSDNTVVAAANGCQTSGTPVGGRAYVYSDNAGGWSQEAELSVPVVNGTPGGCGYSVAVSGGTVVLGALNWAAYVFTDSGGAWTLQATLKPAGLIGSYPVGRSVAISGDTVVLGVPGGTTGGAAYVFTDGGGTWTQQAMLTAYDGASPDGFGTSVAISGGTITAGAPGATVDGHAGQGAAYVFTGSGATWAQQGKLTGADGAASDQLGQSVAIDSSTVVAGAPYAHSWEGAAYVFGGF